MGVELWKHMIAGYNSDDFYFRKAKLSYELSKKELKELIAKRKVKKINLGTKKKCKICGNLFLYKDLIKIPYNKHEQKGFDKIFDTGYHYYCKKCNEVDVKNE